MATFDMTSSATGGVNADSIAAHNSSEKIAYSMEAVLDIASITGYSCTNGDIFQLLEIPANSVILSAGCEILTAFNGTSPTIDVATPWTRARIIGLFPELPPGKNLLILFCKFFTISSIFGGVGPLLKPPLPFPPGGAPHGL